MALCLVACSSAPQPMAGKDSGESKQMVAIGSSTRFIHDDSRPYDAVAGVNSGVRSLITELWYPADPAAIAAHPEKYPRATYGDYVFGNSVMHRRMMTGTTFFHLTPDTVREGVTQARIDAAIDALFVRQRASHIDAPLIASPARLPVVVMTHGDAGSRYNMETVCEALAASGYLVIAPEHTGNSPYAMTGSDPALAHEGGDPTFREAMADVLPLLDEQGAYGSADTYGQSFTPLSNAPDPVQALLNLDRSLLQRLNDLRATLDELERMNRSGPFAGRLDLDRIGLIGRSFGGATTLVGLAMEDRFSAGFAVVPPGWTDQRGMLPAEVLAAGDRESVLLSATGNSPFDSYTKPTFLLSGAEDALIIGLGAHYAKQGGVAGPTADNPHPALRRAFEEASGAVLWGLLADSNHSTLGVSGGYWWPQLKPNTQARTFDPQTHFTLIAPELAQKMQTEKALAFFDLTIRQDKSALPRLLDQSYQGQGLALESRNMDQID
ncbi:MAG: acetylhydrolase [Halieaceae bacterium]|nr:acetylhydrolase [Halieaceae bacterium]